MSFSRRKFIKNVGVTAIAAPFLSTQCNTSKMTQVDDSLEVHLFSKHLQFLDIKSAGQMAAELGFQGLDLTVRPKGHILPENVKTDLPAAILDIKSSGSSCKMMTTAVSDVANAVDVDVIKTAAAEGIQFYRCDWFKYKKELSLEESLDHYKEKVSELSELNKKHNIIGCYQNHSGIKVQKYGLRKLLSVRALLRKGNKDGVVNELITIYSLSDK